MSEQVETLGEALPKEMARVRDEVMPPYLEIGPMGAFALYMMRADLDRAAKAMAAGDVVAMIGAYEALKGYHT
jgi:hypothetical protein